MHWAYMREAGGLAGMRFLLRVYRLCGRWPFRFLLFFVLLWFFVRRRAAREASREYLRRLHAHSGGATPEPTSRNVFRHFLAFSETLLDKLLAAELSRRINYRVDGLEHVLPLLERKQGMIFITAHLGNVELCRKLSRRHAGTRLTVLVHTKNAVRFNRVMKELDPSHEVDLLQVSDIGIDTAIALAQRVEAGGCVVIAGDRVPVGSAHAIVRVPFLGHEADFPIGPYLLAAMLKCPLLAVFGMRRGEGFVTTVRPIAESVRLPRKDRKAAIRPYAAAFAALLEAECLKAPFQWFNFHPFWVSPASAPTKET